jgi:hypothetical protein
MTHEAPSNETANWDDPTEAEVRATNGAFTTALGSPERLTPLRVVSIAAITHSMTGYSFDLSTLPATTPAEAARSSSRSRRRCAPTRRRSWS